MNIIQTLGLMMGTSWASGFNLYATILALGVSQRMHWIQLPGNMDARAHPAVITVALIFYLAEFFADKVPWVDTLWDTIHTLVRPLGGAVLAYMAVGNVHPVAQVLAVLLSGSVALSSHLTKACSRAAINVSPEPVSNWVASLSEDALSVAGIGLSFSQPGLMIVLVILFVIFSFWFIHKLSRFLWIFFRNIQNLFSRRKEILVQENRD